MFLIINSFYGGIKMYNDSFFAGGPIIAVIVILSILISLVWSALLIVAMWKLYVKMGVPGWKSIIPFYNIWVLLEKTAKSNLVWFILFLVPGANMVSLVAMLLSICKAFGKNVGFTVFLFLFPLIALPILGLGKSQYTGAKL